ncbi:phosphoribosylformylglycinamidine cyclo-ligase [Periweissella cryptocerci]|uniref:Phosphoribosylformylglycinamidine cyclo-ligase n=1 Tax=Periweissella cryptocerci TaxID=2506420 RepID=A0A4P6YS85_9LACO|nr:phosphoribosylformylglycinamidine cyclo-ligase [Periweissella cryptocerci]QBO35490.1 phosphoribosylformylglycinamidine cyclo-ligase [Periweissella cryptocerci]
MTDAYAAAGVDITAGNRAVELMKVDVEATHNDNVLSGLGGFGSLFRLPTGYEQPVLVAGSDGVGSKLLLAIEANQHHTVGQDLVAMVANDILAQGAKPLFMLDYLGIDKVRPEHVSEVVRGIAQACQATGMALIGGETAELPAMYAPKHYDLAGFAVGIADQAKLLNPANVQAGDVVLGIASNGLHSNGFSLVRQLLLTNQQRDFKDLPQAQQVALLKPTRLYVKNVLPVIEAGLVVGAAHITGGGLVENLPRTLPAHLQANLECSSWHIPKIFAELAQVGNVSDADMLRTFNLGIGFVLVVHPEDVAKVINKLQHSLEQVTRIGVIGEKTGTDAIVMEGKLNYEY